MEDLWIQLNDGDPVELEDKWGKKCPTQCSVNFKMDLVTIKCLKKNWFTTSISKFTIELWLKPKSSAGLILEIGSSNFIISFNDSEINLIVKNNQIPLALEKKEYLSKEALDDEEPGQNAEKINEEQNNKIKLNFWNHICVVYDSSQARKFHLYLNCILIASGDQVLPNDLFKDQILSLGKEKLNAELTEFRFWSTALSLNEIKDQHRMPLEIVYE